MIRKSLLSITVGLLVLTQLFVGCSSSDNTSTNNMSSTSSIDQSELTTYVDEGPAFSTSSSVAQYSSAQESISQSNFPNSVLEGKPEFSSAPPVIDNEESTVTQDMITLIITHIGERKEITISDLVQISKIEEICAEIFESDHISLPDSGGQSIVVEITKDGVTETYSFIDKYVNGYILVRNLQHPDRETWFYADGSSYSYLKSLFD